METEVPQSWDGRPWVGPPVGRVQGKRLCIERFPSPVIVGVPLPWEGPLPVGKEQGKRELSVGRETPLTLVDGRCQPDGAAQRPGDKVVGHRAPGPGIGPRQGDACLVNAKDLLASHPKQHSLLGGPETGMSLVTQDVPGSEEEERWVSTSSVRGCLPEEKVGKD